MSLIKRIPPEPIEHPLIVWTLGDDLALRYTVRNGNGGVKNLSAAQSVRWSLAAGQGSTPLFTDQTLGVTLDVPDPVGGIVTIETDGTLTAPLTAFHEYWDELEVVDFNGKRRTVGRGPLIFHPESIKP